MILSFLLNRQPGKALPYFLKLRRSGVFDLIREHNLFTDVQDQALLLIEFDQDLKLNRKREALEVTSNGMKSIKEGEEKEEPRFGTAIMLLVDHTHSIPVRYLFLLTTSYTKITDYTILSLRSHE